MNYLLSLCFLFLTLGAHSSENVIEIWTSSENIKNALSKQARAFEEKYQTKVLITVLNKELKTQFQTAGLSQKGPDILCWAHDVVGELANSGLIEPIVMNPDLRKKLVSQAVEAFSYEGNLYGYPYALESLALMTNRNLLPEVPNSFEELAKISQAIRLKNSQHYGVLFELKSFYFSYPLLAAGTDGIFERDDQGRLLPAQPTINSPAMVANAQFLQSLARDSIVPSSVDRSIAFELFTQGKVAAIIDGPWAIADLVKSGVDFEVSPLPTLNENHSRPFLGTHGFMLRRSSKNKQLALELIERYLMTKEGIAEIYRHDPRSPTRADSLELLKADLSVKEIKRLEAFLQSAENGLAMPNIPQMGAVWPVMGEALEYIIQSLRPPEEVLPLALKKLTARP